jgi:hypothetical protein
MRTSSGGTGDRTVGRVLAPALLCVALAACGGGTVQESLGLVRSAPDEFQVVSRAPLILPPDYDLRPPRPGTPGPSEVTAQDAAREALIGGSAAAGTAATIEAAGGDAQPAVRASEPGPAERAILAASGADRADPNIRQQIAEDEAQLVAIDSRRFLFIASWQQSPTEQRIAAQALDPVAEAARLRALQIGPMTTRVSSQPIAAGG